MGRVFKFRLCCLMLLVVMLAPLAEETTTGLTDAEKTAREKELLQKMLEISPMAADATTNANTRVVHAFQQAGIQIKDSDILMERIDDAFTSGDFEKARELILTASNLNTEQKARCDQYLRAINEEQYARAYAERTQRTTNELGTTPPLHRESFFSAAVKSPWTYVALGAIIGGATAYYYYSHPVTEQTVPVHIHW